MKEHQVSADWSATRGEKWLANAARMEATLAPVDKPLMRALHLDQPYRIADIGCGGGATTRELVRHAPAGSVVHGFDISPDLIDRARSEAPDIVFEVADIATAPPPNGRYDRLASRFSTMFFEDPAAAFSNLLQWLAPKGRFAFAVWGPAKENPSAVIRQVVDEIVGLPPSLPDAPGPFRYANVEDLTKLLAEVGFTDLEAIRWYGTLPIGGGLPAGEAASFALASFSNFAEALAAAGTEAYSQAWEALTDAFSRHEHGGVVYLESCVHIVTGGPRD